MQAAPVSVRFFRLNALEDLGELDLSGIHWVIVVENPDRCGPMRPEWVQSILSMRMFRDSVFL